MAEANSAHVLRDLRQATREILLDRRFARCLLVAASCLVLANCSSSGSRMSSRLGVSASPKVIADGQPVPKGGGRYWTGQPYVVGGRTYRPMTNPRGYTATGLASWYGAAFRGRYTSNREIFDGAALSAAHPTLPLPSYVRVTNLDNHRSVVVRVNDRGPFHGHRLIDVSKMTAEVLGFRRNGTAPVRVTYVGPANLAGSDDRRLLATYEVNGRPARPDVQVAAAFPPAPRRSGAVALAEAVLPMPQEARPMPAAVPMPAPPPPRIAAAEPRFEPAVRAPLHLAHSAPLPPEASDPIGDLVASGHPPMPEPRRFAYAPNIEAGHAWSQQRYEPVRTHRVVAAAATPAEPGSMTTASRRVHSDFVAFHEPRPQLRPSMTGEMPDDMSALAPLH
jgi:rare lipoprotein A